MPSEDVNSNPFDRRAIRRNADVQRYTVDLDKQQRRALAMWAAEWDVDKSNIVRTLLHLMETDSDVRAKLQSHLFFEDEPSSDEE